MNELELVNRSLRFARLDTIESLDDEGAVPTYCRENLQFAVDELLGIGDWHWSFARVATDLVQLPMQFRNWEYVYDMPDDLIKYEKFLYKNVQVSEENFELFNNDDLSDRGYSRIATNYEELECVYTKRITVINKLPQYFQRALSYLFAYYLAETFTGTERSMYLYAMYNDREKGLAIASDRAMETKSVKGEYSLLDEIERRI